MAVSGFGTVYIQLDQGSYSPGQQVNGTVFLNVTQNYPGAFHLTLTISGMEDTKLIEAKSSSSSDSSDSSDSSYIVHRETNTFFNHSFPIFEFNTLSVSAGQYNFPFSFLLQPGIPSTFNYEFYKNGNCHAKVKYVVIAKLGPVSGMKDLSSITCVQDFVVNQEKILSSGTTKKQLTQDINSYCCLNKGKCTIVSYFEKSDYVPGEKANMITEIDNSECKVDVLEIKGIFRQIFKVTAKLRNIQVRLPDNNCLRN